MYVAKFSPLVEAVAADRDLSAIDCTDARYKWSFTDIELCQHAMPTESMRCSLRERLNFSVLVKKRILTFASLSFSMMNFPEEFFSSRIDC